MKQIRKYKKWIPALIIPVWILFFIFELGTLVLLNPKPSVRRAWEIASMPDIPSLPNYRQMTWAPFRPRYIFNGDLKGGDLTGISHFLPLREELFKQYFEVDEYGFRNKAGTFERGVVAVILGSSNVGGAQQTQDKLVSSMLTDLYGITTYNYALKPLQYFWEDKRFQEKPPKYVIALAPEGNIIQGNWVLNLDDSNNYSLELPKWRSYEEWWKGNLGTPYIFNFFLNYNSLSTWLNYFSATRYIANEAYRSILNLLFSKEQLTGIYVNKKVSYDPELNMLFFHSDDDDPRLNEKAINDIRQSVVVIKKTQNILKSRGITLIVAAVPTKFSLYYKYYWNVPRENFALVKMEEEMEKNGIVHIKLYDLMSNLAKKNGELLYYKHDTHWNIRANEIITDLLAKKIKELDSRAD